MSASKRPIIRPEPVDLVTALQIVTGELKQIANLRYIERLDYHRIYEALETGQAALAKAETQKMPESCSPDHSDH